VDNWGQEQADGFLHYFEGWIVFMVCLMFLLIEMALLAKIGGNRKKLSEVFGLEYPKALPRGITYRVRKVTSVHYGILATVGLISLSSVYVQVQQNSVPDRLLFNQFPLAFGDWKGDDDQLEEIYLKSLKLDDYLIGDFFNAQGNMVNFYVAYYASQQAGSAAHSPRSCIPGGGWQIEEVAVVELPDLQVNGRPLKVNRLVIKLGEYKQLVY
jgi:hypothetical protein